MRLKNQNTPLNILLADDDNDDRLFFKTALKDIPISTRLTTVQDGEELMKFLSENSENLPDILFLDLSMPRKTGFECLTEIKEDIKLKDLPLIVLTTSFGSSIHFEQSMINTLSNMGSLQYIRKLGDLGKFKEVIHNVLIDVMESKLDKTTLIHLQF